MMKKSLNVVLTITFVFSTLMPVPKTYAQGLNLPIPGTMVNLSQPYEPVIIKGLTVHKDNPFLFDFIVDVGQDKMSGEPLKQEGEKLIKYFLASLAIPEKDLWVNLSPYEKDKTIPEALGQTDMGRDLLAQDYILKQITASLIYPEKDLGRKFWDKVYTKAQQMYGTTEVPVNTFNKVWIMADRAEVFEHNQTAFVVDQHLKVMLEEDYLALKKNEQRADTKASNVSSQIVREIILPEIEKEVNTGKNFANLRQVFNSIILASWYKKNLKQALLNQVYADHSKVKGIDLNDPTAKEQIYQQYLKAYKKGVFNYIKEDASTPSPSLGRSAQASIPRKYFSGGVLGAGAAANPVVTTDLAIGSTKLANVLPADRALITFETGINTGSGHAIPAMNTDDINDRSDKAMIGEIMQWFNNYEHLRLMHLGGVYLLGAGLLAAEALFHFGKKAKSIEAKRKIYFILSKILSDHPPAVLPTAAIMFATSGVTFATKSGMTVNNGWLVGMELLGGFEMFEGITNFRAYANELYQAAKRGDVKELERLESLRDNIWRKRFLSLDFPLYGVLLYLGLYKPTIPGWPSRQIYEYLQHSGPALNYAVQFLPLMVGAAAGGFAGFLSRTKSKADTDQAMLTVAQIEKTPDFKVGEAVRIEYRIKASAGGMDESVGEYVSHDLNARTLTALVWKRGRLESETFYFDYNAQGDQILGLERISFDLQRRLLAGNDKDRSSLATPTRGGIDLNTSGDMQWKVSKDGTGVEMNVDPAMIERVRREGINWARPVIFRMTPVTNVWPLMGLQAPIKEEHLAGVRPI